LGDIRGLTFADVATINRSFKTPRVCPINGQPANGAEVKKRAGPNIISQFEQTRALID